MWWLRRTFWNRLMLIKFRLNKVLTIPVPGDDRRPLVSIPMESKYRDIPISVISVADHIPPDEAQPAKQLFCRLQAWLARKFSPMQEGLPPIDGDPDVALGKAYPPPFRRCFPLPLRPGSYDDLDLGHIAIASPYTCYLKQGQDGRLVWDLRDLDGFEYQDGVRSPGALVEFTIDPSARYPQPSRIDCELGSCTPSDPEWAEAQRIAMCGLSTHLSLVRHFNWVHLVCGDPVALLTRNDLPINHPVRRLLQPHVYATQSSDEMVTVVQMTSDGDFENTYSYTHKGMCELFEKTCAGFDLRTIDPALDAGLNGVVDVLSGTPAYDNRLALMKVIRDHVSRYLRLYYDSDGALAGDGPFGQWLDSLRTTIPRGVDEIMGPATNIAGAVVLLSTIIYMTTVEHEIVDSGVWHYQLWSDVQPSRVYRSGQRQPLDVYQRFVHANFNFQIPRTMLMNDFSYLALDAQGAAAFRGFLDDLAGLQRVMDLEPAACWRIEPRNLKASINA